MTRRKQEPPSARTIAALALAVLLVTSGCASSGSQATRDKGPLQQYQMARVYFEQGKTREALQMIDKALARGDDLPQVHFYRGFIYWNLGEWAQAEPSFKRALMINPYYTDARLYLATVLSETGKLDEAIAELDRAAADRTYGTPEKIFTNKATIYHKQGRLDLAATALRRAIELKPRYYVAHLELAKLLEEQGRDDEALKSFETAAPGYPNNAEFHYLYGRALFRAKREREAKTALQRAVELAPGSRSAEKAHELLGMIG